MDKAKEKEALRIRGRMTELENEINKLYSDAEDLVNDLKEDLDGLDEDESDYDEQESADLSTVISNMEDWMTAMEEAAEQLS